MKQQALETIVDYLTSIPAWYLATAEGDQPHVRPFSFAAAQDDRIWFCTATTKDVYHELTANPKFELTAWKPGSDDRIWFCTATTKDVYHELTANPKFELTAWKPGSGWIILRGCADLQDQANEEVRQQGYDHLVSLGECYEGPNDPTLTFFSFTDAQAWICDIDGSWVPIEM